MKTADQIKKRLQCFAPQYIEVIDDSHLHQGHAGNRGGGHYTVLIVSDQFHHKNRVLRQRMVNEALDDLFEQAIHALSIKALTAKEYFS
ncbi:BolA family protein [Neisseria sp. Ec49-e6-T10]|uniref:BolA family protein n=1 Tax=Neisseria sp. Ec49-e6-T10 TaxID=3140744 RepID=UPI003EBE3EA6